MILRSVVFLLAVTGCASLSLQQREDESPPVFFYVAMGNSTRSHFLTTAVRSLREKGQFSGPIAIVTDSTECLVQNLGRQKSWILGEDSPSYQDDFVTIYTAPTGPVHIIKASSVAFQQGYEQHKAKVREHLKQAHLGFELGTAVVIDADILIVNPVQPFLDMLIKEVKPEKQPIAVFHDSPVAMMRMHQYHHCGLVVSFKGSEKCMNEWYEADVKLTNQTIIEVEKGILKSQAHSKGESEMEGIGQQAFRSTHCMKKRRIHVLPEGYFKFPEKKTLEEDPKHTFMHWTKMRVGRVGGTKVIQEYINNRLQMDSDILEEETC